MPTVNIDGVGVVNFPDGMTPDQIQQAIERDILPQKQPQPAAQAGATFDQKLRASMPMRVVQGMRDPIDAGAQLAPRVLSAVTSIGGLAPNPVSQFFDSEAQRVDQMTTDAERKLQAARSATGQEGTDLARLGGNVISPANLAISRLLPIGADMTVGQLFKQGAKAGAVGGLLTPVTEMQEGQSFGLTKLAQTGFGAAGGAVATPVMTKLVGAIAGRLANRDPEIAGVRASLETDRAMTAALRDIGLTVDDIPRDVYRDLRQQVLTSLQGGKKLDAAALLRKRDFDALEVQPLLGQITRDPTKFAAERNISAVQGVGQPLQGRLTHQNQRLQELLRNYGGNAQETYQAGDLLKRSLESTDEGMRKTVSRLYQEAAANAGKNPELPLQGLAQDFASVSKDFADKVPAGVRNAFNEFGLSGGVKAKLYTVDEADRLIKLINSHVGNDAATNTALGKLRDAVKRSVLEVGDDAYSLAREAASKRFQLQDLVPALKAAAKDTTAADDFVQRFVINGKVNDVAGLSEILKASDQAAYEEMRQQIGAYLRRSAFGNNVTGDALFTPSRFNENLRKLGTDKLAAFFTPGEIEQLKRIGRVGAYINQKPAAAPVQTNPNSWMLGPMKGVFESMVPGGRYATALATVLKRTADEQRLATEALAAKIPNSGTALTPEQIQLMSKLLSLSGPGAGVAAGSPLR